jgi:hypothetical protein
MVIKVPRLLFDPVIWSYLLNPVCGIGIPSFASGTSVLSFSARSFLILINSPFNLLRGPSFTVFGAESFFEQSCFNFLCKGVDFFFA